MNLYNCLKKQLQTQVLISFSSGQTLYRLQMRKKPAVNIRLLIWINSQTCTQRIYTKTFAVSLVGR